MKTTDSVMREKWVEDTALEILAIYNQCRSFGKTTRQDFIDKAKPVLYRLQSHSLAEARREWVEEMVKKIDKLQTQCNEADGLIDGIAALHVLRSDLLTGDNPENECKVCHRTSDVVDMSKCPFCEHDQELIREGRAMSDRDTRRGE